MVARLTQPFRVGQGLARMASEKSVAAYFRGNGANVLKNVPETALKLTLNDRIKGLVLRDGHQISIRASLLLLLWDQLSNTYAGHSSSRQQPGHAPCKSTISVLHTRARC